MRQAIHDKLKDVARARSLITYQKLADLVGLDMHNPEDRVALAQLLDDINTEEVTRHGRRMLSAVVVRQDTSIPGSGFFNCARRLRLSTAGPEDTFYCEELRRVYDAWG